MNDIEKRARDIADVLPAQVDASAWPNGYGDGWNDCARIAHEEILPAIIAALSAAPKEEHSGGIDNSQSLCKCDCGCGRDCCANCGADLGFLPRAVPEGWVLVPVEPTEAMLDKGGVWNTEMDIAPEYEVLRTIWRDMLAAKPEPPK